MTTYSEKDYSYASNLAREGVNLCGTMRPPLIRL